VQLTPGVNFINALRAPFTCPDPKSAIKNENLTVFFVFLGSACVKASCKTLVKLTPVNLVILTQDPKCSQYLHKIQINIIFSGYEQIDPAFGNSQMRLVKFSPG